MVGITKAWICGLAAALMLGHVSRLMGQVEPEAARPGSIPMRNSEPEGAIGSPLRLWALRPKLPRR